MGDWSYLALLLDKVQSHSTVVGKIWMSVLFLFRIFILGAAVDKVWGDEVSEFYCDTLEPGCTHACYNWMFPISYVHYWVLQITFVSTPTLVYLGHAVHTIHKEKRLLAQEPDGATKSRIYTDDRGKVRIKGILFCTYMTQLVFKILLDVGFSVGQFYIFGSVFTVPSFFHCTMSPPCARYSGAQCYISRPTEKTIFIMFMLGVSGVSVLLNIIEIIYLLCNRSRGRARKALAARQRAIDLQQFRPDPQWDQHSRQYGRYAHAPLPAHSVTPDPADLNKLQESIGKEKET